MGQEEGMRILRGAAYRDEVLNVLTATFPQNPKRRSQEEWESVYQYAAWSQVEITKAEIIKRTSAVTNYLTKTTQETGGPVPLPTSITQLESIPVAPRQVLLAAADKEFTTLIHATQGLAVLRIQLPTCQSPTKQKDYQWVSIPITIGSHVGGPEEVELHSPTLRLTNTNTRRGTSKAGKVAVDLPYTRRVQKPLPAKDHHKAVAFDRGVNCAIAGSSGTRTQVKTTTSTKTVIQTNGKPVYFFGSGVLGKLGRERKQSEVLYTKIDHQSQLLNGTAVPWQLPADTKSRQEILLQEAQRVNTHRHNLAHALGWECAVYSLDYAVAQSATIIFAEDLSTLPAGGLGRKQNTRLNDATYGVYLFALAYLASLVSIPVVLVPPRGTSALCPRCLSALKHTKAPDRLNEPGHAWAYCPTCTFSANRDHSATERILSRGFTNLPSMKYDSKTNVGKITQVILPETPVRIERHKKKKGSKKGVVKRRVKVTVKNSHKESKTRTILRDKYILTPREIEQIKQRREAGQTTTNPEPNHEATNNTNSMTSTNNTNSKVNKGGTRWTSPVPADGGKISAQRPVGARKSQKPTKGSGQQTSSKLVLSHTKKKG